MRDGKLGDGIFCGLNMSGDAIRYYIGRSGDVRQFTYVEQCRDPVCFRSAFAGRHRGWLVTSHAGFFRKSYPKLWAEIEDRMEVHARLPAMEEWGEIWIFRLKGQPAGSE